ncbi:retron St85 family RNA-directed DNA polymerase [Vibrio fluvialis]|nr:retron St85 family RNA-directed DNA polymerase [Vibrio fluvialis]
MNTQRSRQYNQSQLRNLGLPLIADIDDLARHMRLSKGLLHSLTTYPFEHYRVYNLTKKTGRLRQISQPSRNMKAAQSWILRKILDKLSASANSKGFEKGESTLSNALPHIGAHVILNIDLEDFFDTVPANHVYSVFHSIGYSKEVSNILTRLTTFKEVLPQGAPTSPKLANLTCQRLDSRIQGYAGPRGIIYTRYADDITLSALNENRIRKAKSMIEKIIEEEGFKVNQAKTRVCGTRKRKEVTGLVISKESVGIGRGKYRELRTIIHNAIIKNEDESSFINGWLGYSRHADKLAFQKLTRYLNQLKKKYPDAVIFKNIFLK